MRTLKFLLLAFALVSVSSTWYSCEKEATCDDGIQNGNETGVDCGGDCDPCWNCDDGIMNGYETGVDCGGPECPPCASNSIDIEWTTITNNMPTPRAFMASVAHENKIYVAGGAIFPFVATEKLEIYDLESGQWNTGGDMNTPRFGHTMEVVDGEIFALGGFSGAFGDQGSALAAIERYDPEADEWTVIGTMNTGRVSFGSCVLDGKIYVVGGVTGRPSSDYEYISSVEVIEIDPNNNYECTSSVLESQLPTPRYNLGVEVLGKKIYALGGINGPISEATAILGIIEEYDTQNPQNGWNPVNTLPKPLCMFSSTTLNDMIICAGGLKPPFSQGYINVEVYSADNELFSATNLESARVGSNSCIWQDQIFVIGGCASFTGATTEYHQSIERGSILTP